MCRKILPLLILLLFVLNLNSVQVKKIETSRYSDFQKGEFKGTNLDNQGRLFLGPRIKKINGPGREYYLSMDVSKNGDIYIGTGHKASVFRIKSKSTAKDKIEEIFKSDQLDIYALLVQNNNDIIIGTSPNGKIFKISKNKKPVEFFNPDEKFIWDLKEDKNGNIICAVGNSGGVYRINKKGEARKIFTAEDFHITSLYITKSNSILAGSGDRGILYEIDKQKVKVLFDSPFEEIKGICEDSEGNIYFSATKDIYLKNVLKRDTIETFLKLKKQRDRRLPLEKSVLYCLHPNGIVEKIWSSKSEYVYSICYDEKNKGIIVGTGNSGRVYRVKKDGSFAIIYESESAQIFKISSQAKGFTIITNNTATIIQIEENLNDKGTYLSEVYDLEIQSKLGKIYWDAKTANTSGVILFVRTGNSNIPDKTWTEWSAPFTDRENSSINISGYRYFQVKALLNSSTTTISPLLNSYKIFYIQSNLKPKMKEIGISKSKYKTLKGKKIKKETQIKKHLKINWHAKDPNRDNLKFNIFLKKVKDKKWIPIKKNITEVKMELETELFEDGLYLLRIVADDSLSNPPDLSKSNALISSPFIIDSTSPVINNFSITNNRVIFDVNDKTSIISNVLYSFDGKEWYPVFPTDMINDSKSEKYNFILKNLNSENIIFIKVVDEFNNYKVFQKEL